MNDDSLVTSKEKETTIKEKKLIIREKEMKISQMHRAALIGTHTIDPAPQKPKSARRGLMQRLGLAFLACALVIGATGSASASARDEAAVRALGDSFAKAFLQKNAEVRACRSPK